MQMIDAVVCRQIIAFSVQHKRCAANAIGNATDDSAHIAAVMRAVLHIGKSQHHIGALSGSVRCLQL